MVGTTVVHLCFGYAAIIHERPAGYSFLDAIAARHLAITGAETVAERLELGRRAIELGASGERPIGALWGHLWRADSSFQLGNLAEMDR